MKVSLNWIKDYVELPRNLDVSKLAYDLTMSTVEVEEVKDLSKNFANIVIGVIKEILPHPNTDKLKICKIDIGNEELCEIVCSSANLKTNMKVVVALPGAKVKQRGKEDIIEVKKEKIHNVETKGIICTASEVGLTDLFPSYKEEEIIDLSDFNVPAGTSFALTLGLNDIILEIDNKSLTNRPDLWGHYGIAREIAALYDFPLKEFVPFIPPEVKNLKIDLKDNTRCSRCIGMQIEGVYLKPSPFEIRKRIWCAGLKPVNIIVDITNYVMLATGQPIYAFDANNINGDIKVRLANNSEKVLLLDGKELSLSERDLVIADEDSIIALAGIEKSKKISLFSDVNKIVLGIANFEPTSIRRTAMQYELRTETAIRYEKGIDPERCDMALSLVVQMFREAFENMSIVAYCDIYKKHLENKEIEVSLEWLESCMGKHIEFDYIDRKLKRLGFKVRFNKGSMYVTVPSWRATGDISIKNDLMEEITRMYGFENFEPMPITTSFKGAINQPKIDLDRKIREYLAFRCGMNEIFTYPWVNNKYIGALSLNTDDMLLIDTPPSPDECYIRSSLLPNLCKSISENLRNFNEFDIFESAQVFFNRDFESTYDSREILPLQRKNVAGACVGEPKDLYALFRKAKGIVESMSRYVHMEPLALQRIKRPSWSDSVIWLNITQKKEIVGNLALLSKKSALSCGIKKNVAILFELDLDLLKPYMSRTNKFTHLAEYPMVNYDLSLLFDLSVKWETIFETIKKNTNNSLIHGIYFVDEYRGTQIPKNKKSVTFKMIIGSFKKTLTSKEIENCVDSVIKHLKTFLGAEYRA